MASDPPYAARAVAGDSAQATDGVSAGVPRWRRARVFFTWLVRVDTQDPNERRRGQILAFLCLPLFLIGFAFFFIDLAGWLFPPSEHALYNMLTDLGFSACIAVAWVFNRRGSVGLAAVLALTFVSAGLVLFFQFTEPHRIEVLFVVPVFMAAFVIASWAAFVWAGISAVSFHALNMIHGGEARLSLQVGLALIGLAIIACLVAGILESAVAALRLTSQDLEADIAARREAEEARRQVEAALSLSQQQGETLFERSSLGVFLFDVRLRTTECNDRLAALMGVPKSRLVGATLGASDEQRIVPAMERALAGAVGSYEGPYRTLAGDTLWVSFTASPLRGPEQEVVGGVGAVTDLTDRKQAEELVDKLAYRDALTGLPNRLLFADRIRQAIAAAQRRGRSLVVGVLDVDRFKNVNDTFGHESGDELLVGAAERIAGLMRESDTVARSGGDEYLLLFSDIAAPRDAATLSNRILTAMREPWRFHGNRAYVSASIGLAVYPDDGVDTSALLENAHTAMSRAKQRGGDAQQFYDAGLSTLAAERLHLEAELHAAIEDRHLTVYYQPQVDTRDGSILGVEALARWRHPQRGIVAPREFIPLAEETGLIVPLGRQILRLACAQAREWQDLARGPLRMAVNVSARQLRDPGLTTDVEAVLRETGLDPGLLEIEITETATLRHAGYADAVLTRLREMGVAVSLDDFGTGYSSLSQLRRLPITRLKIDKSFVGELTTNDSSAAIALAVIDLAHALGLGVVAEGVETPEQLAFLQQHGCHEVQGFLVSHPLPARECTALLERGVGGCFGSAGSIDQSLLVLARQARTP